LPVRSCTLDRGTNCRMLEIVSLYGAGKRPATVLLVLLAGWGCAHDGLDVRALQSQTATHLAFEQQPTDVQTGAAISPAVSVTALDDSDDVVMGYTDAITVAIGTNSGSSTLSGTRTVSAVNGVAAFSDLSLDNAADGYQLSASAPGLSGATSATFKVTPANAAAVDTIFFEGFESGDKSAWNDDYMPSEHAVVTDPTAAHSGSHYLRIQYPAGGSAGSMSHFFLPGYDTVTASYWVRFPSDWQGYTKLLLLRGSLKDDAWSSFGVAGACPDGTKWFLTNVVKPEDNTLSFYTYYVGMRTEADGVTCWGRYGDTASPPSSYYAPLDVSLGMWHHLEFEVILNTPGVSNGSQRMWLDGTLKGEWSGIRFRNTSSLALNVLTLEGSVNGTQKTESIIVDDVLVTRGRRQ